MTPRKMPTPRMGPEAESPQPPAFVPPYSPSWLNRLTDWIDRRPGPAWIYYAVGVLLLAAGLAAARWLQGSAGESLVGPGGLIYSFYPVYFVALTHYLDHQARKALETFRPALGASDADYARIEYELTTVPAGGAWIAAVLAIPLGFLFIMMGSPAPFSLELILAVVYTALTVAAFFVLALHTIRQLRQVSRLHAAASTINLFQPRPTYAFSRLTSRTAIGVLAFLYFDFLVNPPTSGVSLPYFTLTGAAAALMLVAFLLPLLGMHSRLTLEKTRLEAEVGAAVEAVYHDLLGHVRSGDHSDTGDLDQKLTSLLKVRDMIAKLSTWPWAPGTLRSMVGTVVLPILLWLVQFGLGRLLG